MGREIPGYWERWRGWMYVALGIDFIIPRLLTLNTGIRYEDLAYGSHNGFATAGANNGHNGTTLITALNNDDVVEDYAHRSCVNIIYIDSLPLLLTVH